MMKSPAPGDKVKVRITSFGTKGDPIGKMKSGYTVIIPDNNDLELNSSVEVEIFRAFNQYAFGRVV